MPIYERNAKEMRRKLKEVQKIHDEELKAIQKVRDEDCKVVLDKFHTMTKGRVLDAYRDYQAKLGDFEEMKSQEEWKEIHTLEEEYFRVQKEVKLIMPEARAVKDRLIASHRSAFDEAEEKIEDDYDRAIREAKQLLS